MEKEEIDEVLSKISKPKVISYLRNLVKIPSYLGREAEKADYVAHELERLGLEVIEMPLSTIDPRGRRNVLGILRGNGTGKSLMICAHLDTHWPIEGQLFPHEATIKDDKIYGVGTGDSMTPIASFLGAIDAIRRAGVSLKGDLIFAATADELGHKMGARVMMESGLKADMCIEGDVGNALELCCCTVGKAELEIRTKGYTGFIIGALAERAGMKSVNAVVSMNKIINHLQRMVKEEPYFHQKHPMLPGEGAAFYIGPIIGGSVGYGLPTIEPGTSPGQHGLAIPPPTWCKLRVGVRYWPGQTSKEFVDMVKKWVDKAKVEDPSIEAEVEVYLDDYNTPWEASLDSEVIRVMRRAVKHVIGEEPKPCGIVATGEMQYYAKAGMRCVGYGTVPLRINVVDEHVTVDELITQCKVYTAAMLYACV